MTNADADALLVAEARNEAASLIALDELAPVLQARLKTQPCTCGRCGQR